MQLTFFVALAAASQLSTAAVAAHAIVGQLWMLISNLVDGFAAAGIVLGSRLAGLGHDPYLAPLAKKCVRGGVGWGGGEGGGVVTCVCHHGARLLPSH